MAPGRPRGLECAAVKPSPSVVLVCSLVLPAFSGAQTPSPYEETVVVTASADKVPLRNVGRSLIVLSRRDIERLPARRSPTSCGWSRASTCARAVRAVCSPTSDPWRRFGQTLVLVDGLRINDAQSGHHNGDIPVALDEVERIEILLGAGSSLHGADAFGGTIECHYPRPDRASR